MKISVVMCTYNGQRYLQEQLTSIADQTQLPDELIVSDDVSTDGTWAILRDFANSCAFPVILKQNERNLGVTKNFESALAAAGGDVMFLSDQDDVWRGDKIERTILHFQRVPSVGLVFTDAEIVDDRLSPLNATLWDSWSLGADDRKRFEQDPFRFLLTEKNIVTGAAAAFSRRVVSASLPFPTTMPILHDAWLSLIAAYLGVVSADPAPMLKYRQHAAQLTGVRKKRLEIDRSHYENHLVQLKALSSRIAELSGADTPRKELVDEYVRHLQARLQLPSSLPARLLPVARELLTARYSIYSSGLRSAAKDILRGG